MAKIKMTQTGSPIRRTDDQRATLIGLGLNKMHKTVELEDTPRGPRHDPRGAAYGVGGGLSLTVSRRKQGIQLRTCPTPSFRRSERGVNSATKAKASARHETERNPRQ